MLDLYLNDSIASLLFQSWKPEEARDRELIERSRFRAGVMYDFLEHRLDGRTWLMGEDFTMADCAAGPALLYAGDLFPFAERPALAAYWERLRPHARPMPGCWRKPTLFCASCASAPPEPASAVMSGSNCLARPFSYTR